MRKGTCDSSLKPNICLAELKDLSELIELDKICIKEEKFNKNQWKYFLLKAKSFVLIASIEGKIIGSIVILLRKHIANARIYILNVHPKYRRIGVGSLLMETTLLVLRERGYKKVTIETGIDNQAAINLYISKGFLVDKILEKYYRNGMEAKHLILMLTDQETKKNDRMGVPELDNVYINEDKRSRKMILENSQQNANKTQDWILRIEGICAKCGIKCCEGAHPPICEDRYDFLIKNGVSIDCFEFDGYRRLKVKKNNECVLFHDGKCSIHHIKPETCRAGPFTFDIKHDKIEIFLKYESLCPIVQVLKNVPEVYNRQYLNAIEHISYLVSHLCENELEAIHKIDEPLTEKVAEIPRIQNDNRHRT